jgi:hypothetical protein
MLVGMSVSIATMELSMEVPQKTEKRTIPLLDPAIPLLDMSQKEGKSAYNKDTCTPMLIEVQFTVAKL